MRGRGRSSILVVVYCLKVLEVATIDSTEFLVDVTTVDANNPSNGFLRGSRLSTAYFPGAAAVIRAKHKWDKYRFLMKNANQQLVPFVLEV